MPRFCVCLFGLFILAMWPLEPASAQTRSSLTTVVQDSIATPRLGLVLGGGGARGLAHIGVLKVLEEAEIPVDVITGTSMGSVVGALYASGYSADSLEALVLRQNWATLFPLNKQALRRGHNPNIDERFILHLPLRGTKISFPLHLMDQQPIYRLLARLLAPSESVTNFYDLPIPYGAVATHLATGEPHLFTEGSLVEAVLASMSIPGLLAPVTIDSVVYVDGGVARNLPVPEAQAMDADLTLAVFTGAQDEPNVAIESFTDVASETLRLWRRRNAVEQFDQADVLIQPDLSTHAMASFEDLEAIILAGEDAARAALPAIDSLLSAHGISHRSTLHTPSSPQPVAVREIHVDGFRGRRARALKRYLRLQPNMSYSLRALEDRMDRGYETGRFSHLYYTLASVDSTDQADLTVHARSYHNEWLGGSVHYDTEYALSALLATRLHLPLGTWFEAQARIGELVHAELTYHIPLPSRFLDTFYIRGEAMRLPYRVYADSLTQGERAFDRFVASSGFSFDLGHHFTLNTAFLGEYSYLHEANQEALFWTAQVELRQDGLDALDFPMRGTHLRIHTNQHVLSEFSQADSTVDSLPSQIMGRFSGYLPVTRFFSFYADVAAGSADVFGALPQRREDSLTIPSPRLSLRASSLENYYWGGSFFVGGYPDYDVFSERHFALPGSGIHSLSGIGFGIAAVGVRLRLIGALFASAQWTYAFIENPPAPNLEAESYAFTLGTRTPIGPMKLTFAQAVRGIDPTYPLHFSMGYVF